jgi:hypothetical protein
MKHGLSSSDGPPRQGEFRLGSYQLQKMPVVSSPLDLQAREEKLHIIK